MEIVQEIGSYAGLAAVLGLAVLSALYFSQARDVKRLREWAGRAPEREVPAVPAAPRVVATPQAKPAAKPAAAPAAAAGATAKAAAPAVAKVGPAAATPAGAGKQAPPAPPEADEDGVPAEGEEREEEKEKAAAPAASAATATPETEPPAAPADDEQAEGEKPAAPAPVPAAANGPPSPPKVPTPPPRVPASATARRPTIPPRPPRATPPRRSQTMILPPQGETEQPPWYRRLLASPRYLVLVIAGVLIIGGAAAFGVTQLGGEDEGTGGSQADRDGGRQAQDGDKERPRRSAPVVPSSVTVSVLNGTTVPGLAAQIGDRLEGQGFKLGNITNSTDQARNESVILFASGHEREAVEVGKRLRIAQRELIDPESQALAGDASVVVVAGADQTQ